MEFNFKTRQKLKESSWLFFNILINPSKRSIPNINIFFL